MVEAISGWVKNIIMMILFATFLEILLPHNNMQRIIKVIMGLLILLAVVNPLMDFFLSCFETETALPVAGREQGLPDGVTAGENFAKYQEQIALEQYKKELAKQMRVLAGTVAGVADARAAIQLEESKGSKTYGMVKTVTLFVKPGVKPAESLVAPVRPVDVGGKENREHGDRPLDAKTREAVRQVIAEFYHLRPEQIDIQQGQW